MFTLAMGARSRSLLAAVAVLLLTGCGGKTPSSPAPKASSGPSEKWRIKSNRNAFSYPAVGADGTIYAGASDGVYAISPDGKLLWTAPVGGALTPAIASNGNLYVASSFGFVNAVGNDGKVVWNPRHGLIGFGGPPAVGADSIYFANVTSDIFAFQPERTNDIVWSLNTYREGMTGGNFVLSGMATTAEHSRNSPVIWRDETIVLPRQHWLDSFTSDGRRQWTTELTPGSLGNAALADDGTAYVGDDQHVLYAVDHSGTTKWVFDADGGIAGSPVVDTHGTIFFATGDAVYALAPDGQLIWRTHIFHAASSAPAFASDGTLYVPENDGLAALNPDGQIKWIFHTMAATSAATIGPDGTIYLACGYMWICAVHDSDSPLMKSPWPKMFHDPANTGRILTEF